MSGIDALFPVALLAASFWALLYLLPRARRERDAFSIACSLLAALAALAGWLFVGVGLR